MTVRVLDYRGDGTYYLCDPAHELDGLRQGPPGRVLLGRDGPVGQRLEDLLSRRLPDGVRAFDVIVAAPKPVSVLLAIDPARGAEVVALHQRGVDEVLGYLCDEAGSDGRIAGPMAIGFTHGINRLGDPHLHTHVLVSSHEADGTALRGWRLRTRAATADALYLSSVRHDLAAATGRDAWLGPRGGTHVEGVGYELVAATTSPRERDGRVVRASEKPHPTRDEARAAWKARIEAAEPLGHPAAPARTSTIDEYRFAASLGNRTVGRHDVIAAWAGACVRGAPVPEVLEAAARVAPGLSDGRQPSVVVRDDAGVRVLGPRPIDPAALGAWIEARHALGRYLADGHRLGHLLDPSGASARTWLAVARFDAERDAARRGARVATPDSPAAALRGRGVDVAATSRGLARTSDGERSLS